MTGGLDEKRALEHIKTIHEVDRRMEGRIRVFTGIEVDILADGAARSGRRSAGADGRGDRQRAHAL